MASGNTQESSFDDYLETLKDQLSAARSSLSGNHMYLRLNGFNKNLYSRILQKILSCHEDDLIYRNGIMGVPITFLDKYCPEQFEILDINPHFFSLIEQGQPKPKQLTLRNAGKKDPYARILIKRKEKIT